MRARILVAAALAVPCFAVLPANATAAGPLHGKKTEISQEKREEDEREDVADKTIVERELAAELPGEEQFDNEQQEKLSGKPGAEERPPEVELVHLRTSVAAGTLVKARVTPHGSFTQVWMYLDWAKKCNTQVNCQTKGKYVHEASKLGTDSARPKDLKGKFSVGECQVGEWVLTAINHWGVARATGWFGDCY